jgi:hypothetical protein
VSLDDPKLANINGIPVEEYLRDCVDLNPDVLDEEMVRLPADYAYWNERHTIAFRNFQHSKLEEDRIRSQRRLEMREEHAGEKGKGPTMDDLKAMVDLDGDVQQSALDTINAEVELKRMKGILDALSIKRDMVQSIGARLRLEMMNDPAVRARLEDARAVRGG